MTQFTELPIANQSGLQYRQKTNSVLQALNSSNAGEVAPTVIEAYMTWLDTSTTPPTTRRRDASNTAWDDVSPVLTNDLSSTDPLKGASLIGYKATGVGTAETNLFDKLNTSKSVFDYGAVMDGIVDDTAAITAFLDDGHRVVYVPSGKILKISAMNLATRRSGDNYLFVGDGRNASKIRCTLSDGSTLFDNPRIGFHLKGVTVENMESDGTTIRKQGKCLDAAATGAAFWLLDDLRIVGFRNQGKIRQSIWCTIGDLECSDYLETPVDFVRQLKDGSEPTGGWNEFPSGWFNNALRIGNYLCRRGQYGPTISGAIDSIDVLTCEALTIDGPSIEGKSASDRVRGLHITTLYTEAIPGKQIKFKNTVRCSIGTWFHQGGAIGTPSAAAIELNGAEVRIDEVFGQDYYSQGAVLSNGSILRGNVSGSLSSEANRYVKDSTSRVVNNGQLEGVKRWNNVNIVASGTATLIDALPDDDGLYSIKMGVIQDGTVTRVKAWELYKFNSSTVVQELSTNTTTGSPTISTSGNNLVITNTVALALQVDVVVINHRQISSLQ